MYRRVSVQAKWIPVAFYRSRTGNEPVRDWLRTLSPDDRKSIGTDLKRVQEQWPVGMPVCKPLGRGLWEVRSSLGSNRIARVLFCFHGGTAVVLHGFIKKTQRTPPADLAVARERMREVEQ
jgi:phage-related protein